MTAARSYWRVCDAGQNWCKPSPDASSHEKAKRAAQALGWHRTNTGKDICPECWKRGARPA